MNTATEHESFDLMKADRRNQARQRTNRVLKTAAWGALIAIGLKRGRWLGLLAAAYGLQGAIRTLAAQPRLWERGPKKLRSAPPVIKDVRGKDIRDSVDLASRESFPASDPPGQGVAS